MLDLEEIGVRRKVRDPIYGYIWLTDQELAIVDTPLFQRLRRVHQLALTKYVYPSAEHSRFSHSLGVLQAATRIFQELFKNKKAHGEGWDKGRQCQMLKKLRLAALLHDIGHQPFSHGGEESFLPARVKHEDVTAHIIGNYKPIAGVISEMDIQGVDLFFKPNPSSRDATLRMILSGELDADRADYLLRDSHCCGVKYGQYDFERYVQAFQLTWEGGAPKLNVHEGDIYVLEAFLMARYHYSLQVLFHRTRVGYDLVLTKYLQTKSLRGELPQICKSAGPGLVEEMDFEQFEARDDCAMFEEIKEDARGGDRWARMLLRQEHLRAVLDENCCRENAEDRYRQAIAALTSAKLVADEDFFVYTRSVKLSNMIRDGETNEKPEQEPASGINVLDRQENVLGDIKQFSRLIQNFSKPLSLYRVYAAPEREDAVRTALSPILGRP